MKTLRVVWPGLLIGLATAVPGLPTTAQTTSPMEARSPAPRLRKLTGDDARRADELDKAIETALKTDHWEAAIARAEELVALRTRIQGSKHFEVMNAEWQVKTLRRVAPMPHEDRVAYQSSNAMDEEAERLYEQRKYAQAKPLFQKALEIRRRLLTDDHPDTAKSLTNVATMLFFDEKYAQAQPIFEQALEIRRRLLTDDHPLTANSYHDAGGILNAQAKYAQAQQPHEKVLEIRRRLFTDNHPDTAHSFNNLALNLDNQGKYAEAQPLLEKALEIRRGLFTDESPETAGSYNNLATNLVNQGKHAEALPLSEKALEIKRRLLTDDHDDTATSYNNVAMNLSAQGKYVEARPLLERSLEICQRLLTDNHYSTAISYVNMAGNLRAQGMYGSAQPLFEKALEICRRVLTDNHPHTAKIYNLLGNNLLDQKRYSEAQPCFEKALDIDRRLLTDNHPITAACYSNLAYSLASQGKYAQAQPLFEKALEIDRRMLTSDHPDTARAYARLAENLHAQGKYVDARDRWLRAVKILDIVRLRVASTGLERAGTNDFVRPALAAVQARLGEPTLAWNCLEEGLGRGLLDELAARQDRRLTPAERARLRKLTFDLEQLDKLVESNPNGLEQAARSKRFNELKGQRALASIALGEFQTKVVQDHGALAGQVADLGEIQASLPDDTALIAWVDVLPVAPNAADPNGEHWSVVVRSRGMPIWIRIIGAGPEGLWTKDDIGLPAQVRTELRRRPGGDAGGLRSLIERLRMQRVKPLAGALAATADGLPPARRLIVLPSRALAGIPIEAIMDADGLWTVSYAPSATVYKYLREQSRLDRHAGLLALGDPIYDHPEQAIEPKPPPKHGLFVNAVIPGSNAATHGLKSGDVLLTYNGITLKNKGDLKVIIESEKSIVADVWRDGRSSAHNLAPGKLGVVLDARSAPAAIADERKLRQLFVTARGGDDAFSPLPGTRYEVEALIRLFQSDDRPARALLGADASEPELNRLATSGELGRFGFIHLATHGVIDEGVPARSAVILTQTGLPDPLEQVLHQKPVFDGRLLVREIQRGWDLKAELVTLSACETALGRNAGGEGFVGFTQALLMSGARSVCLSLWKVDDAATALLMQRFYANLLGRRPGLSAALPKADALRESKTWLRGLRRSEVLALTAEQSRGIERGKGTKAREPGVVAATIPSGGDNDRPYEPPHFWAAFVLSGDPD